MKRVLIVGDSISMSYNESVTQLLSDVATVWRPDDNCRFAKYTLWYINEWLKMDGMGKPDVIHWNNGIWDTYRISDRVAPFVTLDEYLVTMKQIYREMKMSGAKILFATTTPVGKHNLSDSNERIDTYNAAVTEYLTGEGVPINDLNALFRENPEKFLGPDLLHLNDEGVELISAQVADFIRKYI